MGLNVCGVLGAMLYEWTTGWLVSAFGFVTTKVLPRKSIGCEVGPRAGEAERLARDGRYEGEPAASAES